jgi:hypothetical protein
MDFFQICNKNFLEKILKNQKNLDISENLKNPEKSQLFAEKSYQIETYQSFSRCFKDDEKLNRHDFYIEYFYYISYRLFQHQYKTD